MLPTSTLRRALAALGTPSSSPAELAELTDAIDPESEGHASYENFVAVAALKLHARTDEAARGEVEAAFGLFTRGGRGEEGERITLGTLRRVARELKEEVDEQVLKDMITEANGGAGVGAGVGMEEFEEVMKRAGVFR